MVLYCTRLNPEEAEVVLYRTGKTVGSYVLPLVKVQSDCTDTAATQQLLFLLHPFHPLSPPSLTPFSHTFPCVMHTKIHRGKHISYAAVSDKYTTSASPLLYIPISLITPQNFIARLVELREFLWLARSPPHHKCPPTIRDSLPVEFGFPWPRFLDP